MGTEGPRVLCPDRERVTGGRMPRGMRSDRCDGGQKGGPFLEDAEEDDVVAGGVADVVEHTLPPPPQPVRWGTRRGGARKTEKSTTHKLGRPSLRPGVGLGWWLVGIVGSRSREPETASKSKGHNVAPNERVMTTVTVAARIFHPPEMI